MLSALRSGAVTGHAFWSWNDVREYSRIDWPTFDGILFPASSLSRAARALNCTNGLFACSRIAKNMRAVLPSASKRPSGALLILFLFVFRS